MKKHILLVLAFISLGINLYSINTNSLLDRSFITALFFFLLGKFSYELYLGIKEITAKQYILIPIILFFIFFVFIEKGEATQFIFAAGTTISLPFLYNTFKDKNWDRYLGELSYPAYICHVFLLFIIEPSRFPKFIDLGTTLLVATLILSVLLNEFVSKPLEKYRQKRVNASIQRQ